MTKDIDLHDENANKPAEIRPTAEMTGENVSAVEKQTMREESNMGKRLGLFNDDYSDELCSRWNAIQAEFVDHPHASIEHADTFIAEILQKVSQHLADQHKYLRNRWYEHDDISTEDLRLALQDYRSFFNNLLSD